VPEPSFAEGLLTRDFLARPAREVAPDLLGCVLERETAEGVVAVELTEVEAYEGLSDPASHSYRGRTPRNAIMWGPPGFAYVYFTYGMHYCVNAVCETAGTSAAVLIRAGRVIAGEQLARQRRQRRPSPGPASSSQPGPSPFSQPGPSPSLPRGPASSPAAPDGGRPDEVPWREVPDRDLARGPARLCQALAVTRAENGLDLCDPASPLRLYPAPGPRVVASGQSGAGKQAPSANTGPEPAARISVGPRVGVTAALDAPLRFWLTGDPTVSAYRLHKPRPR
jgi:DNA-3-methyladenine glycosylase